MMRSTLFWYVVFILMLMMMTHGFYGLTFSSSVGGVRMFAGFMAFVSGLMVLLFFILAASTVMNILRDDWAKESDKDNTDDGPSV